ncbi:MAG: TonB-dependent receptor [Novosphingobium sp.]|nr:TonB-dependent receptor [Novosphingobium sp.]
MRKLFNSRLAGGAGALALAIGLLQAAPALAQDDGKDTTVPDGKAASDDASTDVNEIVVVGSTGTNISGVKPVGSEAVTLDREQIQATGMTTAADVVRTLPQVRNIDAYHEGGTQASGANSQQGNAINLRGLGSAATLTLVDGHRVVATGAASNFTEANQVPLAAIERIEVIADGASAIYGSDAVAGVVNYVLRKDFEGIEASVRVSNNSGGWEYTPGVTAGTHWNLDGRPGNIIVSYEYTHRNPWLASNSPWTRQDLRSVGGPDLRINGATNSAGSPGNIFVSPPPFAPAPPNTAIPRAGSTIYYGLPDSATGVGLTLADLRLNDPNLIDTSYYTDYTGKLERHHVSAFFNQEVTDWLSLFAEGSYSHRHTFSRQMGGGVATGSLLNVTVPAYFINPVTMQPDFTKPNPAYISGIPGVAPGSPISVGYNISGSTGLQNWDNLVKDYNVTGGIDLTLPGGWKGEGYFTHGYDDSCNVCNFGNNIDPTAVQYLIDTGKINPFSTAQISPADLAMIEGDNIQEGFNTFDDWVLKFDGPLFDLPGGTVRSAFGGEIAKIANWNINGANRGPLNVFALDTDKDRSIGRREIDSVFGELYVPIVGPAMNVPLIQELTVDGAVRYDNYSDVGSTTNPKVGVTWVVNDMLTLRGSWGTSFRAPGLPDVNPAAVSAGFVISGFPNSWPGTVPSASCFDPSNPATCSVNAAMFVLANPDIGPERATNWSLGGDFTPVRNLRFSATYYNISYKDRILGPDVITAWLGGGAPDFGGYGKFIIPVNNTNVTGPNTCTLDPALQAFLDRPILYGGGITNPCLVNVILDGRETNLAATRQDGIDAAVNYTVPITDGSVNFNLAVNTVLNNTQQVVAGGPFVDVKNHQDQPVEWRGRASIGMFWRGFNATLFGNYTGSYTNYQAVDPLDNSVVPPQKVDSWTTFDLTLGYSGEQLGSFLKGYRLGVTVQNLFDRDPPLMITSQGAFNSSYSNPYGRTFTLQVSTSF